MQVGDDEEALVLVLQAHTVAQAAHVVAQVQLAGGTVAGEYARSSAFREMRLNVLASPIAFLTSRSVSAAISR